MDIDQIKAERKELQDHLAMCISKFIIDTGVNVSRVEYIPPRVVSTGEGEEVTLSDCKVNVVVTL